MSRIGRMPIAVPAGVTVEIAENNKVTVKGPKVLRELLREYYPLKWKSKLKVLRFWLADPMT